LGLIVLVGGGCGLPGHVTLAEIGPGITYHERGSNMPKSVGPKTLGIAIGTIGGINLLI